MAALYVHHICGYSGEDVYEERARLLSSVGFVRLRSLDREGKYWEIWYLPHESYLTGGLAKRTIDEARTWLMNNIGPGRIEQVDHSYGLGAD
jgi:hypothetical protein